MTLGIGKARPAGQSDMESIAVMRRRLSVVDLELNTLQLVVQDDVDDARDCIRTVDRRCTAGHHFRPRDQQRWNYGQVHGTSGGCRNEPLCIDQRQRPGAKERIEAAKVCQLGTDIEIAGTHIGATGEVRVLRQLRDHVADGSKAQRFNRRAVDHRDWIGSIDVRAHDA